MLGALCSSAVLLILFADLRFVVGAMFLSILLHLMCFCFGGEARRDVICGIRIGWHWRDFMC